MVTALKYRKALLISKVEECIKETLKWISERYERDIDEICFDQNHIQIFCGAAPKLSPLRVISIIKSIATKKVFERFPKLKKEELCGGEFWSDGKYIGTVEEAAPEKTIRNYIRNQSLDNTESEVRMKQLKLFKI